MKRQRTFTLIELLVVIGILVILIAILLPTLSKAQKAARTAKCSTNLHSLSRVLHTYFVDWGVNNFGTPSEGYNPRNGFPRQTGMDWDYRLFAGPAEDYGGLPGQQPPPPPTNETDKILRCPETSLDRSSLAHPTAHTQWLTATTWRSGSYAINWWLYIPGGTSIITPPTGIAQPYYKLPTMNASTVPVFVDSATMWTWPQESSRAPKDVENSTQTIADINNICINRHSMTVNVAFFDGHVENTKLGYLWTLKWADRWSRSTPETVPAK